MVKKIKNFDVVGIIENGRCPSCKTPIVVRDEGYTYIKNRGLAKYDNGEGYIKCSRCGGFVMLPKKAA